MEPDPIRPGFDPRGGPRVGAAPMRTCGRNEVARTPIGLDDGLQHAVL